ncbi:MAG: hypothetical protein IK101_05875 [Oscillospiraceae bacterium]|nr:hypothetical protein [Oscillospiraceae bacterium]
MFRKHRFICLLLALLMIATLAACANGNGTPAGTAQPSGQEQTPDAASQSGDGGGASGSQTASPAKLTGKLDFIDLDDRDASVLCGVSVHGNQAGSAEFNAKDPAAEGVRCVFELGEWIEFYPDADAEYYLRVWILRHRDDQKNYKDCKFSDLMPGFASYCDLHYPEDAEDPGSWYWGSFFLPPEECETGYYDFVFTYEGKAIAVLQTRFYNENELASKSDAELEALMRE